MKLILNSLFEYKTLPKEEAKTLFTNIVLGKYNEAQISSLMTVFLMRSISEEELLGFKEALFDFSNVINFTDSDYIDIVGTGGDGKDTFNISTLSAIVTAAAGYKVVKHGNYGATSISGASNILEYSGVVHHNKQDIHQKSLDECNMAYLHAPIFNSAMKEVANVRKNLGIRNFFNMLGPLINPASPRNQLLGTYNLSMQRLYSYIYQKSDVNYSVVHSIDGYDEISLTSDFKVISPKNEKVYSPEDLGFSKVRPEELFAGTTMKEAADIFYSVLDNKSSEGQKNCVIVNSAFAIQLMEQNLNIQDAIAITKESLESGMAKKCFKKLISINS